MTVRQQMCRHVLSSKLPPLLNDNGVRSVVQARMNKAIADRNQRALNELNLQPGNGYLASFVVLCFIF